METTATTIESKAGVCGGKPCVRGTRIRVQDIYVWHELQGLSADEIVSRFPQLTMADVYAALTHFWEHRDEIQKQMREDAELVEAMMHKNPSPLQHKLAARDGSNHPLSS